MFLTREKVSAAVPMIPSRIFIWAHHRLKVTYMWRWHTSPCEYGGLIHPLFAPTPFTGDSETSRGTKGAGDMTTFREAITYFIESEMGLAQDNGHMDDYVALEAWLKDLPELREDRQ